jgi:hypothetical protein
MPIESHRTTQTGKTNEKYKRRRERKILVEKWVNPERSMKRTHRRQTNREIVVRRDILTWVRIFNCLLVSQPPKSTNLHQRETEKRGASEDEIN